jgi:hypothetical protein
VTAILLGKRPLVVSWVCGQYVGWSRLSHSLQADTTRLDLDSQAVKFAVAVPLSSSLTVQYPH